MVSNVFRNPLVPFHHLNTRPSSPGARESVYIAITIDHLRKKGAMKQKANISHGKTMTSRMARRRELPCTSHSKGVI
jgi:hypothetical protein